MESAPQAVSRFRLMETFDGGLIYGTAIWDCGYAEMPQLISRQRHAASKERLVESFLMRTRRGKAPVIYLAQPEGLG